MMMRLSRLKRAWRGFLEKQQRLIQRYRDRY